MAAGDPTLIEMRDALRVVESGGFLPPTTHIHSDSAETSWQFAKIAPSPYLYIYRESRLTVRLWSAISGATFTLAGLFIGMDGEVHEMQYSLAPTSDRAQNVYDLELAEGFLLGLTLTNTVGTVNRGAAFAIVQMSRGTGSTRLPLMTLVSDQISSGQPLGWPGGFIRQATEGPGTLRVITGTTPAVGAEISETVPTGARWHVLSFAVGLTTSATAADRYIQLSFGDASTATFIRRAPIAIPASTAGTFRFGEGYGLDGTSGLTNNVALGLPNIILLAGMKITTVTLSIQAGDAYSSPKFMVEEWIEP